MRGHLSGLESSIVGADHNSRVDETTAGDRIGHWSKTGRRKNSVGKLDGKVAIVTGASRGIGRAIAEVFAAEGARVVCAARTLRNGASAEGSLEDVATAVRMKGGDGWPVQCDVGVYEDCQRLAAAAQERYGRVDVLVNNAAVFEFRLVQDYTLDGWLREAAINMHGPVWMSQLVLGGMAANPSGAIINLSSPGVVGPGRGPYKEPGRGFTMYQAAKAFIERFTQGFAQEVYHQGGKRHMLLPVSRSPDSRDGQVGRHARAEP
ncbi:MAG: SDR family oxidoreductase, partial [SAR202 cluster bacterium]|nr:SDR family oxidoreductase [SAR202 cluster bacterium]